MRISTSQMFIRGLEQIQNVKAQLQQTQLQIASGKKVVTPADDPVAAARIMALNQELALNEQFQKNNELAEINLQLQDGLLDGIGKVIKRIRELAVQSGNGSLNVEDRGYIADEIKERLDQLVGMLNTRNGGGDFLFSGFQGDREPFIKDSSGHYQYHGDEGVRFVQIEPNVNVAVTENGKDVFVDIKSAENTFFTRVSSANKADPAATITSGITVDQAAYDAFYPEDMTITFNTGNDFTVTETSTGKPIMLNVPYVSGQAVTLNGIQFNLAGSPVAGDSFFVESTPKQSILTTIEKLTYGLENFVANTAGRAIFDNVLELALQNLDSAETSYLNARSRIGARLNKVETTSEQLKDSELLTQEVMSTLNEVDYAEAVSLMTMQKFILEAAYASYSQITSLSLFDRL